MVTTVTADSETTDTEVGGGFGKKGVAFGGYGYGQTYSQLEEMTKEQERKLEEHLSSMVDWSDLNHLTKKLKTVTFLVVSPS